MTEPKPKDQYKITIRKKGGPGSGNHGHKGLSGVWGGSSPKSGGSSSTGKASSKRKFDIFNTDLGSLNDLIIDAIPTVYGYFDEAGKGREHAEDGARSVVKSILRWFVSPKDARESVKGVHKYPNLASNKGLSPEVEFITLEQVEDAIRLVEPLGLTWRQIGAGVVEKE